MKQKLAVASVGDLIEPEPGTVEIAFLLADDSVAVLRMNVFVAGELRTSLSHRWLAHCSSPVSSVGNLLRARSIDQSRRQAAGNTIHRLDRAQPIARTLGGADPKIGCRRSRPPRFAATVVWPEHPDSHGGACECSAMRTNGYGDCLRAG